MTLQELQYLVALADQGHFVRAAQACHVAQPTLSMQIRKLEDDLGVTLFERGPHRLLQPTPIGAEVVEHARLALEAAQRIRSLARRGCDPMEGRLRLGVIPTLGPYLIPHLLPALRRTYPALQLCLREDLDAQLLNRLRQGRLDVLLLALPVLGDDIATLALFREAFAVALPQHHPLAAQSSIGRGDLADQTVLLLEEGHCMRDQARAICGGTALDEREELKATSIETLRQMVAAGVGCALLPRLAATPGLGSIPGGMVQMRPFAPPEPMRTIGLVWRHHDPGARSLVRLGELIRVNVSSALPVLPAGVDRENA